MATVRTILQDYVDEINLVDGIIKFVGNECEKCGYIQEHMLKVAVKWTNGTYAFDDIPNADYEFRKLCNNCVYSRCSAVKIYLEVNN